MTMSLYQPRDITYRFFDVIDEPCTLLTPIKGFHEKPLVSLNEAVEPLRSIVPDISKFASVAKCRASIPTDGLTIDESAAIQLYTMEWEPYTDSVYYILNKRLRTEDRELLKPWFLYLRLITHALNRLPSSSLTAYRGLIFENEDDIEKYQKGKEIIWWGFSSCSKCKNISEKTQFLGTGGKKVLFIINCANGKYIANHSYFQKEHEILLLPATTVYVTSCKQENDDLITINLNEIRSSEVLISSTNQNPTENLARHCNPKLQEYLIRYKPNTNAILNGTRLTEDDIKYIVRELVNVKRCPALFLSETEMTEKGASAISRTLQSSNVLERLFLSQNRIGDNGTLEISRALSHPTNIHLKYLCLGYNDITDDGVKYLATMLENNRTLTHLSLPKNRITKTGLQYLATVLINTNRTLQSLGLEWNYLGDLNTSASLVEMINKNQTLMCLNVYSCKIPNSIIRDVKKTIKSKPHHQRLTLQC